jgi:hypothetical protein
VIGSGNLSVIEYMGPAKNVNRAGDGTAVGCDITDHPCRPGINLLWKTGDVVEAGPSDPLYTQAKSECD